MSFFTLALLDTQSVSMPNPADPDSFKPIPALIYHCGTCRKKSPHQNFPFDLEKAGLQISAMDLKPTDFYGHHGAVVRFEGVDDVICPKCNGTPPNFHYGSGQIDSRGPEKIDPEGRPTIIANYIADKFLAQAREYKGLGFDSYPDFRRARITAVTRASEVEPERTAMVRLVHDSIGENLKHPFYPLPATELLDRWSHSWSSDRVAPFKAAIEAFGIDQRAAFAAIYHARERQGIFTATRPLPRLRFCTNAYGLTPIRRRFVAYLVVPRSDMRNWFNEILALLATQDETADRSPKARRLC